MWGIKKLRVVLLNIRSLGVATSTNFECDEMPTRFVTDYYLFRPLSKFFKSGLHSLCGAFVILENRRKGFSVFFDHITSSLQFNVAGNVSLTRFPG